MSNFLLLFKLFVRCILIIFIVDIVLLLSHLFYKHIYKCNPKKLTEAFNFLSSFTT